MMRSSEVRPTSASRHRRLLAAAVIVLALLTTSLAPTVLPAASADSPGLDVLGTLEIPPAESEFTSVQSIVGMNPTTQRLYVALAYGVTTHIAEYDMSTEVPTFVRLSEPNITGANVLTPNTVITDSSRNQLLVLGLADGDRPVVEVIDLETLTLDDTWEMATTAPGFAPTGMTYDERLDRIYLVGRFNGTTLGTTAWDLSGSDQLDPGAAVVAVDPSSASLVWVAKPHGCDQVLKAGQAGATVRLSERRPMLYFFCKGGSTGYQPTGQSGLMRMNIKGSEDTSGLADFPTEFFPVSGNYSSGPFATGVAGFDPVAERFFAHSLSSLTHGAWVFDGLRSSWIGFVAAPDAANDIFGLDPATGKHYMGGSDRDGGYINVTDGRATPVPQGRLFDDIAVHHPPYGRTTSPIVVIRDIAVDAATQRLFVPYGAPSHDVGNEDGPSRGLVVLRDTTPTITPRPPLDLDELTHDLDDEDANLEFSANTSGFGASYAVVGGWENVYTRPTVPVLGINVSEQQGASNPAELRYGNRGATMSLVERIGIASSGSSATAIANRPDENTPADAETKQGEAESQANEATDGGVDDLSDAADDLSSDDDDSDDEEVQEARYVTCLDGIGESVEDEAGSEEEPAHAVVKCDLKELETTAKARFSGGSGGGGVVVSDSSFDGRTFRDPARGVVTETEAIAEGIFFGEANVGGFGIDRVTSTATTWANGLDGTSHVRWVRTVEGARTFAADGTASEPESCTTTIESGEEPVEEGECESLKQDLNALMPNRFEVRFPMPEVVATPGGAFASVQETETDFLSGQATNNDQRRMVPGMEMTVFADGAQRGRLWVQLAAVKADATFIRSPKSEPFGTSTGGGQPPAPIDEGGTTEPPATSEVDPPASGETTVAAPVTPQEPEVAEEPPITIASHEARLVGGFGWVPALRSLGDAILTGALYLVFLLPLLEVVRRRRLLDVLVDEHAGAP